VLHLTVLDNGRCGIFPRYSTYVNNFDTGTSLFQDLSTCTDMYNSAMTRYKTWLSSSGTHSPNMSTSRSISGGASTLALGGMNSLDAARSPSDPLSQSQRKRIKAFLKVSHSQQLEFISLTFCVAMSNAP